MSIYVLRSDNLVKIGFTENLRQRVQAILATVPVPVEFVGHMPGGRDVEAHLHERFAASKFSGEWFVETPAMRAAFDALLTPRLPEMENRKSQKRRAEREVRRAFAEQIRVAAADRWPHLSKGERVATLAAELGWNIGRARDFYYSHPRMALRAFEKDELERWMASELTA